MRGWPDGLKRSAGKGWPGHANYALGRLYIEGKILFLKMIGPRITQDCGLTEEELRRVLNNAKIHKKGRALRKLVLSNSSDDDQTHEPAVNPTNPGAREHLHHTSPVNVAA